MKAREKLLIRVHDASGIADQQEGLAPNVTHLQQILTDVEIGKARESGPSGRIAVARDDGYHR